MNNNAENDFFGLRKVNWLYLTGEAVKFSQDLTYQKMIKIG